MDLRDWSRARRQRRIRKEVAFERLSAEKRKFMDKRLTRSMRIYRLLGFLAIFVGIGVIGKVIHTATVQADDWQRLAKNQVLKPVPSQPECGAIFIPMSKSH